DVRVCALARRSAPFHAAEGFPRATHRRHRLAVVSLAGPRPGQWLRGRSPRRRRMDRDDRRAATGRRADEPAIAVAHETRNCTEAALKSDFGFWIWLAWKPPSKIENPKSKIENTFEQRNVGASWAVDS